MTSSSSPQTNPTAHLRRSLGLWALIFYGIVLIQPTAPMPLFGVVMQEARGHAVTTILIGMVAMLFTAVSYGRMARAYPSAGSAYTYVGREIHSGLGFVTGWSMAMDYMLNPLICTIWCSKAALNIVPQLPYPVWVFFFAALFTAMNVRSIRATARTNQLLVIALCAVVAVFLLAAIRYLLHVSNLSLMRPFYDPATFSWRAVSAGTSIAVLTYIGFDGISTLSEEAHNPRHNIMVATVLTCLITGILASVEVYAGQLIWPDYRSYPDADTAFVHVAGRAGGAILFHLVNFSLLVATIGSGAASQLAAARLLYGMGRDNTIPKGFFGALDPRRGIPRNNVIAVGVLACGGALVLSYQLGAELLNFGAFIGFMGVNAASFIRYYLRSEKRRFSDAVVPALGFVICAYIWLSLRMPAKIAGGVWLLIGVIYGAYKSSGFRRNIEFFGTSPGTEE